MTEPDNEAQLRRQAEHRVGAKMGFYMHAAVYVLVNAGLVVINFLTSPHTLWFFWPLSGWGIGLVVHGFSVLVSLSSLRERALEAEMKRLREQNSRRS